MMIILIIMTTFQSLPDKYRCKHSENECLEKCHQIQSNK